MKNIFPLLFVWHMFSLLNDVGISFVLLIHSYCGQLTVTTKFLVFFRFYHCHLSMKVKQQQGWIRNVIEACCKICLQQSLTGAKMCNIHEFRICPVIKNTFSHIWPHCNTSWSFNNFSPFHLNTISTHYNYFFIHYTSVTFCEILYIFPHSYFNFRFVFCIFSWYFLLNKSLFFSIPLIP